MLDVEVVAYHAGANFLGKAFHLWIDFFRLAIICRRIILRIVAFGAVRSKGVLALLALARAALSR